MTVPMVLPTREIALALVLPIILFNIAVLIEDIVSFFKITWVLQMSGWMLSSPSSTTRCRLDELLHSPILLN